MSKYMRHQPAFSRNSDTSEDSWLEKMQQNLEKEAVQPRNVDQSLFHQINSIMNGKSKYPSVAAAVEDMKARSGLTAYLEKENISKTSEEDDVSEHKKTASAQVNSKLPLVIQKCPQIQKTLENYVNDTNGNMPISAILERIKSIHRNDVSDAKDWEDDKLLGLISNYNLKAKRDNPTNYELHNNLGKKDISGDDVDPSNTDAFFALTPARM